MSLFIFINAHEMSNNDYDMVFLAGWERIQRHVWVNDTNIEPKLEIILQAQYWSVKDQNWQSKISYVVVCLNIILNLSKYYNFLKL